MKRLLLISLVFFTCIAPAFAQNSPLLTFEELLETFKRGYDVRGTFYYAKCDFYVDEKKVENAPDIVGGMNIDVFEYFGRNAARNSKAFITFYENKMIENPVGSGYVYNYVKVRVYEDGNVSINIRHVDPLTLENKMQERFETKLYDGNSKAAGAYFFVSH
jgi:hypothetical protein